MNGYSFVHCIYHFIIRLFFRKKMIRINTIIKIIKLFVMWTSIFVDKIMFTKQIIVIIPSSFLKELSSPTEAKNIITTRNRRTCIDMTFPIALDFFLLSSFSLGNAHKQDNMEKRIVIPEKRKKRRGEIL